MKKLMSFLVTACFLLLFSVPSYANVQAAQYELNKDEIRKAHAEILKLVENNESKKVNELTVVKKYKKLFSENPELLTEYLNSLDNRNEIKIKEKMKNVTVKLGEKKTVLMDDGSFIVLNGGELKKISSSNEQLGILAESFYTYGTYTYVGYGEVWNVLFNDVLYLRTTFTNGVPGVQATSTSTSGTTAYFPDVIAYQTSNPSSNTADDNGEYVNGFGTYQINTMSATGTIAGSRTFGLKSTIKVNTFTNLGAYIDTSIAWN
jgi:hypothetical protein